ncbi:peptidoglycan DD-metalloendopeptidase family protein [Roseivirga sp. E12]|uniref:peptidoglycan DD-metalloendopeptidase family protein n=1 Tax=Roseivirga sp. E12 TaxID=2819237 RepID=UPI001ABBFD5C|nr:peptidoglycan DD-metalloendopeptidase family protein [Roseivirga sp. E12]MBO3697389.1 peptidoglycan DD-metalloendopeptidase family protein [Roseivirga sp. E12]
MSFEQFIKDSGVKYSQVVRFDEYQPLDLSKDNTELSKIDLNSESSFTDYIFTLLQKNGKTVGIGGYAEERSLYSRIDLFEGEEPRTIHLGVDVWSKAGTKIYAPLEGRVHSYANRDVHGDYGPVIILEHTVDGKVFHTLYGHLSLSSLEGLHRGKEVKAGHQVGTMGEYAENYHWPPHLHFQLLWDMQGYEGDYPGVAKVSEREVYLRNCPDPSIFILK